MGSGCKKVGLVALIEIIVFIFILFMGFYTPIKRSIKMELKEKIAGNKPFPGIVHDTPGGGIVVSTFDSIINWARSNSLWPLSFATSCCGIEMMSTASAKYDFSRFGFEVARASPRQADVIIIAGTIVNKMAPVLKRLYDQMADPKYVIAMGACAISGGPFFTILTPS